MPPSRLKSSWKRLKKPKLSPRSRPSISQTWSRTNLVTKWKQEAQEHAGASARSPRTRRRICKKPKSRKSPSFTRQIGRLTTQLAWPEKRLSKNLALNLTPNARLALIEREEDRVVPVLLQARLLSVSPSVSRSRLYYEARPCTRTRSPRQEVLVKKSSSRSPRQEVLVKHRLDEWYTKRPCLVPAAKSIGFIRICCVICPSSGPTRCGAWTFPLSACVDIPSIRLRGGFLYLVAFLDWFSRLVVAWELSETFE